MVTILYSNRNAQQLVPSAPTELTAVAGGGTSDTVKFEEKRMMSASKTKVIKDGFSSEQVKIGGKLLPSKMGCAEFDDFINLVN